MKRFTLPLLPLYWILASLPLLVHRVHRGKLCWRAEGKKGNDSGLSPLYSSLPLSTGCKLLNCSATFEAIYLSQENLRSWLNKIHYKCKNKPKPTEEPMSYFDSPKQRRNVLDKLRIQLAASQDAALLEEINFSDWNAAFDHLNKAFWNGALPKIPVRQVTVKGNYFGMFWHNGSIDLNMRYRKRLSGTEFLGVLLHEMCHHFVEWKYGHGKSSRLGGKNVIGHGVEWKREMKRVGYTGKITRFTGPDRF